MKFKNYINELAKGYFRASYEYRGYDKDNQITRGYTDSLKKAIAKSKELRNGWVADVLTFRIVYSDNPDKKIGEKDI